MRAGFDKIVERNYGRAARFNAVAGHETRHAEEIEDRLVDAVGRERAKTFEIVLALKFRRTRTAWRHQVYLVRVLQLEKRFDGCRRVCGVERPVAVGVRGIVLHGTCCAAFGVGFAQDDGQMAILRVFRDDLESCLK